MPKKAGPFNFFFPRRGKHTDLTLAMQPAGTCVDCLNILPYDLTQRARGGQRPGLRKKYSLDHGGAVETLFQAGSSIVSQGTNGTYINGTALTPGSQSDAIMAGNVEIGDVFSITLTIGVDSHTISFTATAATAANVRDGLYAQATGAPSPWDQLANIVQGTSLDPNNSNAPTSSLILTAGTGVSMTISVGTTNGGAANTQYLSKVEAFTGPLSVPAIEAATTISSTMYYLNSGTVYQVSTGGGVVTALASTAGSFPTGCTLISNWRGRLILANANLYYMSRSGDPGDFDYTATDDSRPIAGSTTNPIVALIPFTKDQFLFGLDREFVRLNGDPTFGGQMEIITPGLGMVSDTSWTIDPQGTLWMLCTGGLFKYSGVIPEPVHNDMLSSYFQNINQASDVLMAWDRDRWALMVHSDQGTIFYDERNDGFWPLKFYYGVYSLLAYDGDAPNDRAILIGCADGYIRYLDPTSTTDENTTGPTIPSYIWFGPFQLAGVNQRIKTRQMQIVLGEQPGGIPSVTVTPDNVESGDVFTLAITVGSYSGSVSFTATASSVANVTRGLAEAVRGKSIPPFTQLTVVDNDNDLFLYGPAGVSVIVVASTTNGGSTDDQTLSSSGGGASASVNCDWTLQCGKDAYTAWKNPEQYASGSFTTQERQATIGVRLNGNVFYLRLGNGTNAKQFTFEQGALVYTPSGRQR